MGACGAPRPRPPEPEDPDRLVGSGNSATSSLDPAGSRKGSRKFVPRAPRTREQWREEEDGDGDGAGEGTENRARGPSQTPEREKLLSARLLPRSEAESPSPRWGGRGRNQQFRRGETEEKGKPSQRTGLRAESANERTRRGCGTAPGRAEDGGGGGDPRGPGRACRRREVLGRPARAHWVLIVPGGPCGRKSPAGLCCAGTRPAGGGKGKCEAPKRRRGAELTFVAPAGAGAARSWGTRALGRLTSRRPRGAGQGRTGWTARGALCGRGLPESGGPSWSLLSVPRTSQWRAVPSHAPGCLAPEGGRRGGRERGVGGTGPPGLPSRGVPGDGLRGARSLPGGKAVGNPNGGPVPPREDFRGKFSFRQTINTPIGWQATLS